MTILVRQIQGQRERDHAFAVRRTVFIEEQQVPEDIEHDEYDLAATHVIALQANQIIGTGRLALIHGLPRIGRMAVLNSCRGQGAGRAILEALLDVARQQGHREVHLAAQTQVMEFYRKCGFVPYGELFKEAAMLHRMMRRSLILPKG